MRCDLEHPDITTALKTGWPKERGRYIPPEDDFISVVDYSLKESEQSE